MLKLRLPLIFIAAALLAAVIAVPASGATPKLVTQSDTVCALSDAGAVSCWGDNYLGALGDGTGVAARYTAAPVVGLSAGVLDIGLGADFGCAVRADHTVVCWGANDTGVLTPGTGDSDPHPTPVVVAGISDAVSIATSYAGACVVLSNGTAKCWGHNLYGQVGDGLPVGGSIHPIVQVSGLTNIARIDAANFGNCALLTDQRVSCWGDNGSGELGREPAGFGNSSSVPTIVPGISGVVGFRGGDTACVLLADTSVKCWGDDSYAGLGDPSVVPSYRSAPGVVPGQFGVTSLEGTGNTKCTRKGTAAVSCWGYNGSGQIVLQNQNSVTTPTQVAFGTGALVINSTANSTALCWVERGGAVHCRGANYHGEGGSPTPATYSSPDTVVQGVDAITNVYASPQVTFGVSAKTKLDKKKKTYTVTTSLTAVVPAYLSVAESCNGSVAGKLSYSYKKYKRVKGKRKKYTVKKSVKPKGNLIAAGESCTATLKFKLPVKYLNKKRVSFSASWPGNTSLAAFSATSSKYRLPKVKPKKAKKK